MLAKEKNILNGSVKNWVMARLHRKLIYKAWHSSEAKLGEKGSKLWRLLLSLSCLDILLGSFLVASCGQSNLKWLRQYWDQSIHLTRRTTIKKRFVSRLSYFCCAFCKVSFTLMQASTCFQNDYSNSKFHSHTRSKNISSVAIF